MGIRVFTVTSLALSLLLGGLADYECGWQANDALCPNGRCCSQFGYCGDVDDYCCDGCQSQCHCGGLKRIFPKSTFEEMLLNRNDNACPARGFYTYEAFIEAAKAFPSFGNQGDDATRKREIAAFFGQTSHQTTAGSPTARYSWGYCYVRELNCETSCLPSPTFPCAPGRRYCGRGPMQLSWNFNYGQCGQALGVDLLENPELVETDPVLSFKTAIWFWMTSQSPKPSCHDVITGVWEPSPEDLAAGRVPGYGVITNIINGGIECGNGPDSRVDDRIGYYKRYCDMLGIDYGDNLDCYNQRPFGSGILDFVDTI